MNNLLGLVKHIHLYCIFSNFQRTRLHSFSDLTLGFTLKTYYTCRSFNPDLPIKALEFSHLTSVLRSDFSQDLTASYCSFYSLKWRPNICQVPLFRLWYPLFICCKKKVFVIFPSFLKSVFVICACANESTQ